MKGAKFTVNLNGKIIAAEDLYSEEQTRRLKNHVNRAARLLQTVSDEDLVAVARATVKLNGRFVKQGMAALANPVNARHNAICEIALMAYPHVFVPDIRKGEAIPESSEHYCCDHRGAIGGTGAACPDCGVKPVCVNCFNDHLPEDCPERKQTGGAA